MSRLYIFSTFAVVLYVAVISSPEKSMLPDVAGGLDCNVSGLFSVACFSYPGETCTASQDRCSFTGVHDKLCTGGSPSCAAAGCLLDSHQSYTTDCVR